MRIGMDGLHLRSYNRLFFNGILFITLIGGVCLVYHFSSASNFISFSSLIIRPTTHDLCINNVNGVVFDAKDNPFRDTNESLSFSVSQYTRSWSWAKSNKGVSCGFQKLDRFKVTNLLNGSWVVVAGDSQTRTFFWSFLEQVLESKRTRWVKEVEFKRRKSKRPEDYDYRIIVDEKGMKLEFVWARFVANLSSLVGEFKGKNLFPDVLVMGSGPWHMLCRTNASDYGVGLRSLRSSIVSWSKVGETGTMMGSIVRERFTHMFWLGMPIFITEKMKREEKKKKMNDPMWHAYNIEVIQSKLLRQYSGGPFLFLNISSLSRSCGPQCTSDGLHYDRVVYEPAAQTMLNALLIESHEKL